MSFTLEEEKIYKSFHLLEGIDSLEVAEYKKSKDSEEPAAYDATIVEFMDNTHLSNKLNNFYELFGMKRIILFYDKFRKDFKDVIKLWMRLEV